jgi:hypothetical protein
LLVFPESEDIYEKLNDITFDLLKFFDKKISAPTFDRSLGLVINIFNEFELGMELPYTIYTVFIKKLETLINYI